MTNPTAAAPDNHAILPVDPRGGLTKRLANRLAPLFVAGTDDLPVAQAMAACAIASYQPETYADVINSARVIAFSMSALAALARAASPDMPPALQLRYLGKANTLNRSADQSERAMERRRRCPRPQAPSMQPEAIDAKNPQPMTAADVAADLAVIDAAVAEAMRHPVGDSIPAPAPAAPATAPAMSAAVASNTTKAATETAQRPVAMPQATSAAPRLPAVQPIPVIHLDQRPGFAERLADDLMRTAALRQRAPAPTMPSPF